MGAGVGNGVGGPIELGRDPGNEELLLEAAALLLDEDGDGFWLRYQMTTPGNAWATSGVASLTQAATSPPRPRGEYAVA